MASWVMDVSVPSASAPKAMRCQVSGLWPKVNIC